MVWVSRCRVVVRWCGVCSKFSWVRPKFGRSPDSPPLDPSPDSTPSAGPPSAGPPKISLFFFSSPATIFILSSSLGGHFVEFWPGFHTTAREPKRAHFRVPALESHHQFHETTPKRGRKNENSGEREKKSAKFWAPHPSGPFGPPTFGTLAFGDPRNPPPPDSPHCF